jgi:hypothetical protein
MNPFNLVGWQRSGWKESGYFFTIVAKEVLHRTQLHPTALCMNSAHLFAGTLGVAWFAELITHPDIMEQARLSEAANFQMLPLANCCDVRQRTPNW